MNEDNASPFTIYHFLFTTHVTSRARQKKRREAHSHLSSLLLTACVNRLVRGPYLDTFTSTFDGTLEPRNSPPLTMKKPTTSTSSRIAMIATTLTALLPPPSSAIEITLLQSFRPNVLVNVL